MIQEQVQIQKQKTGAVCYPHEHCQTMNIKPIYGSPETDLSIQGWRGVETEEYVLVIRE